VYLFSNQGGKRPRGFKPPAQQEEQHRINEKITAREVRLISATGEQLGVVGIAQALKEAEAAGLDLVEVAPGSKPPVCRLMDYGKFKYREQKKEAEARKKRTDNTVKELRIRYRTDVGDLETKLKHAREFIANGDKVKFTMRFKGREAMFVDLGVKKFDEIIERLADVAQVDERSPPQGKQIHIVLAPVKKK
jgi:translation initiation factor IF-3